MIVESRGHRRHLLQGAGGTAGGATHLFGSRITSQSDKGDSPVGAPFAARHHQQLAGLADELGVVEMMLQPGQLPHQPTPGLIEHTALDHAEGETRGGLRPGEVAAELDHWPSWLRLGTHAVSAERASTYR